MIRLFCKRALYKRLYSAKETYICKEPTNRSYPTVQFAMELTFEKVYKLVVGDSLLWGGYSQ